MSRPLSAPDFQQLSPSALKYSADWFLESQEGRWAASMHAALCSECLRWTTLLLASSLCSPPDAELDCFLLEVSFASKLTQFDAGHVQVGVRRHV